MPENKLCGSTARRNAGIQVIQAPNYSPVSTRSVFLAGGITGCPNWQADAIRLFQGTGIAEVTLMNPRREQAFPCGSDAIAQQVRWENFYLDCASVVLFWFTAGQAVQPIALYELGKIGAGRKPVATGADVSYRRRVDVILQLSYARPNIAVYSTLEMTVARARKLLMAGT